MARAEHAVLRAEVAISQRGANRRRERTPERRKTRVYKEGTHFGGGVMLQVSTVENVGAPTWGLDWRVVDGALRTIAKRRAGLDADEARWLREAEAIEVWRPLGMVNALDYLE